MPDYSNGKIYKIVDNTNENVYIGSTCKKNLSERLSRHVSDYKHWLNGKRSFVTSFKIIENDNYEILLLESFPCKSKDELYQRERFWTKQIDCVNKYKNQGIYAEIGQKEYDKNYYENNKEKLNQKIICECGGCYTLQHRARHLRSKKHQYYEQNKVYFIIKQGLDLIKAIDLKLNI